MKHTAYFFVALLLISFYSCNQGSKQPSSESDFTPFILNKNLNIIAPDDEIFVQFRSLPFDKDKMMQKVEDGVIQLQPQAKGEWKWSDNQTLRFYKSEVLDYNTLYTVTVDVKKLYVDADDNQSEYIYNFNTENLFFKVDRMAFESTSKNNTDELNLNVSLKTNADLTDENIKTYFNLEADNKNLAPSQFEKKSTREYTVSYGPLVKGEQPQKIEFVYDINTGGASVGGSQSKTLPSISQFAYLDAFVNANNSSFQVTFSDPLKNQKFDGLVKVKDYNGGYKFSMTKNKLDVFLDKSLIGNQIIQLSQNILSAKAKPMMQDAEFELSFKSTPPAVRSVAEGNIVPYDDKVIFPFEAISLDTVEVQIFKIFENNVYEFLKYDQINSNTRNGYFGRVVHTQNLVLSDLSQESNKNEWKRYALDLSQMVKLDPGAIYQVGIGFRKSFISYPCDEGDSNESQQGSVFDFSNYYRNYNYEQRENPCYNSFYESNKFIYRNILASNMGLIAKKGKDKVLNVFVSDLRTSKPLSGVSIQVFDKQRQEMIIVKSDSQGKAVLETERGAAFLIAKNNSDYAYLSLIESWSNRLADFDVSGANIKNGLSGFIYGERGVWRPGDTLHLSFMVFDSENKLDKKHPARLRVKDSQGQQKFDQTITENENGIYVYHVPTSKDDITGTWSAQVKYGNLLSSKSLKIETIKPNRIKVDLQFASDEIDVSNNENFELTAAWLHGALASHLKAEVDIQYKKTATGFDSYKSYVFDDPSREVASTMSTLYKGNLDEQGQKKLKIDFGKQFKPPGKLRAQFKTRVYEKSGNYSEDFTGVNVNPYEAYTGVSVGVEQWGDRVLNVEEDEKIKFVSVDKDGKPLANKKLKVGIYEASWNWWYNRTDRNLFRHNSSTHLGSIDKVDLVTSKTGEASYLPKLNGHGTYLVRVCDEESGHCSGQLFYTSRWSRTREEQDQIAKLEFTKDKEEYSPGETIKLSVPSHKEARMLVSLENNQEVLKSFWMDCQPDQTAVEIPVTADMTPNIYVHVTLVQGSERANDMPMRLYGVLPVKVLDPQTVLEPLVEMPNEIRPNKMAELTVREAKGKSMSYTLALVDEGLLDITNFKTPQPWDYFYQKQSLGVRSWDMYDFVLNKYGGEIEKIITIGGDGELSEASKNLSANRFVPVVRFLGPFSIDENSSKKHEINIPNYVGALRVMVIAKNDVGFGNTEKNVTVKDPLMVMTTLPRVLAPDEKLSLPVNVFAYDDNIKSSKILLKHSDNIISEKKEGALTFDKQGDKLYNFDIEVGDKLGIAKIEVVVNASQHKAYEDIEIDIRNPSPEQYEVYTKVVEKGQTYDFAFANVGMPGTNKAQVELSLFPDFNLNKRLKYLIRYPYGCVEQTTSSVFPQLYLAEIMDVKDDKKITRNVEAAIRRLVSFQKANGGLSYWPGSSYTSNWGTSYAGHFLLEARNKGYFVSEPFIKNWIKYQKAASKNYSYDKYHYHQRSQAYRLYTLALVNEPNLSAMNNLRLQKGLHKTSKFILAGAYALLGQHDVAESLLDGMNYQIEDYRELGHTYGSGLRDRAMLLSTLQLLNKKEDAYKVALGMAKDLSTGNWYSTQTTAFSLMSLSKFISDQSTDELSYALNMDDAFEVSHTSKEKIDFYELDLSEKDNHNIEMVNKSEGPIYLRLVTSGKPKPEPSASYNKGLTLGVRYEDEDGKSLDPTNLKLGTDFKAVVTIKHSSNNSRKYEELALNHTLPSGWEIRNLRLGGINTNESNKFDYQDIRDDRVYTFFDLNPGATKTFVVHLTAAFAGEFFMPNVSCEAMYDKEISSSEKGAWIKVLN